MSREEIRKSRMSPKERAQRRAAIGKTASEKVAKSEQLNFRLEEKTIRQLQELAYQKSIPLGTMIRDWVVERLLQESTGKPEITGKVLHVLDEIYGKLHSLFSSSALQSPGTSIDTVAGQNRKQ